LGPPKGGVPPTAGRGELLGPPKGGVPPKAGRGATLSRPAAMEVRALTA
jgi:hypothetical protein